jgi:uncharacterized membrane protein SpoIIM required for sporulation
MISARWLEKRRPHWARLEDLVKRSATRGVRALGHSELRELGLLYRQTASDLATVREDPAARQLAAYLNQLLGRAHNRIYLGRRSDAIGIVRFYRHTYPRIFRQTLPYTTTAFALFLLAAVFGFLLTVMDPGFARHVLGPAMVDTIERQVMWTERILTMKPQAASGIMTNNLAVSFAAFAGGMTAGLLTLYIVLMNGVLMGVIDAACWQAGMLGRLYDFVALHGVLELPAIFISAGAGLLLARGILFPGLLPRRAALVESGGMAVRLFLGSVPLLILAGVIEGFLSPSKLPTPLKFALAAVLFGFLLIYLFRTGREADETHEPDTSDSPAR